jgi:hypothetical protein
MINNKQFNNLLHNPSYRINKINSEQQYMTYLNILFI